MGRLAARGLRSLPRLSTPPLLLPQDRNGKGNRTIYGRYVRIAMLCLPLLEDIGTNLGSD